MFKIIIIILTLVLNRIFIKMRRMINTISTTITIMEEWGERRIGRR